MKTPLLYLAVSLLFLNACQQALEESVVPQSEQLALFDEFTQVFGEKYAMFESKGVNWEALAQEQRSKITMSTTEEELFDLMGEMVLQLRDGHTVLMDPKRNLARYYDYTKGYPQNFSIDILNSQYVNASFQQVPEAQVTIGILDDNIGYLQIPTFEQVISEEMINWMLRELRDTRGLIVDVRQNSGGDPDGAARLAAHFTDQRVYIGKERFKTSPPPDGFTENPLFLYPSPTGERYLQPIVVLTNRRCFSATTTLIYYLNPLDHVTFIGGRTGGGSSGVADGTLSNGWYFSLSISEFVDWQGRYLDDGFDPDIEVQLNLNDPEKDELLERAMVELR